MDHMSGMDLSHDKTYLETIKPDLVITEAQERYLLKDGVYEKEVIKTVDDLWKMVRDIFKDTKITFKWE